MICCNLPQYVLRHQRELVGFVNPGETNNHLIQFEQQVEDNTSEYEPLANSMVVTMVRRLFTHLCYSSSTRWSNGWDSILNIGKHFVFSLSLFFFFFFHPCITAYGLPFLADNSKYVVALSFIY